MSISETLVIYEGDEYAVLARGYTTCSFINLVLILVLNIVKLYCISAATLTAFTALNDWAADQT
jgi:hypothetical protein